MVSGAHTTTQQRQNVQLGTIAATERSRTVAECAVIVAMVISRDGACFAAPNALTDSRRVDFPTMLDASAISAPLNDGHLCDSPVPTHRLQHRRKILEVRIVACDRPGPSLDLDNPLPGNSHATGMA